jgi:sulfate transport system substrate-binding protein
MALILVGYLYTRVRGLHPGPRGSTTTFVQRGIGDVLLAWENEAFLAMRAFGQDQVEIVVPSMSILAEPPVALVDKNADEHGTRKVSEAYLQFLYSPEGQEIAARNFYRPTDQAAAAKYKSRFPEIPMVTIDDTFGGWQEAQKKHFSDGGIFDQIYRPGQ